MSAKWEKQEGNEGVLTFEVSAEEFDKGLDKAFDKVKKTVQVPGFRKGKIPRKLFESRFGVESLYQDAIDFVLPEAYGNAIEETGIEPVDQPSIDVGEIEQGSPLVFTATVTVKPEVELGEYKNLEVDEQSTEVTDEEVNEALEQLREQQAELIVKEDGAVEEGNTVVIDFEGFLDGEAFDGGKGENYSLEIGSNQFIPGFEEQLVGKKAGEETVVTVTFPEDYHEESLAGKETTFNVTIHEIKEKEVPELDDDFAQDQDVDTLDELKAKTKEDLKAHKEQDATNAKKDQIIEQATENASVDIPQAMIDTEVEQMVKEFEQRLQAQGMTLEMFSQFSGQSEEDVKEQMKENADQRVKMNLVIEAISKAENIEVSEEDINAELEEMAKMYNTDAEQLKQMLGNNFSMLEDDLKVKRTIDFLLENSKVKEA
ncbi:MAG TPA: trigger factor [Candidatus Avamphibacillus intestinigallinarum]|nr:trigger factor [Candidatus Avamphibacillus intestinigallinarum]